MSSRLERVRLASLRVALISTAITAGAFAVISVVIVMYVTATLTGEIDSRLTSSLTAIQNRQPLPQSVTNSVEDPQGEPYGPVLLAWLVTPEGQVLVPRFQRAELPPADTQVTEPVTARMRDTDVRLAGAPLGGGYHLIVGQTMAPVNQARSTIIGAEAIVGGALLVLVFFGAIAVGRRVGAPIELARQRQMEFTADASHELRTPLSVIEAQTSLALAQDRDPLWYRAAFERIRGESQRIRRLVEDLLWLARADTAAGDALDEPVDVGVLAQQAADRFSTLAEARGLDLSVVSGGDSHVVQASTDWLDRLLGVLLENACKYTPAPGRVTVSVGNDGGRVRLAVEDSGPGIPAGERHRIFNRFHRSSDIPGGAGLGLAIADAVVRHTHGRWEVGASQHLGGASMAVSWPRALGGREAVRPIPAPPPLEAHPPSQSA